jgi:hypothetical protein
LTKSTYSLDEEADTLVNMDIAILKLFAEEHISCFPNVQFWMLSDNKPVGLSLINVNDILWSKNDEETGHLCAKMVYFDIKVFRNKFPLFCPAVFRIKPKTDLT